MPIDTSLFESWFDPTTAEHQLEGIQIIANEPFYAVFDEQGTGKTMQAISAASIRFMCHWLDALVVVAPKNVVGGWANRDWGEIKKHCFVKHHVYSFRSGKLLRLRTVDGLEREDCQIVDGMLAPGSPAKSAGLHIICTNYDQIRNATYRKKLFTLLGKLRVGLVLDESHKVKYWKSAQTKACRHMARRYPWRVIMTGTPRGNSVLDLWSQYDILSPLILKNTPDFPTFRAHHTEMGGYLGKEVIKELHLDELQALTKPYTIRRLKKDCVDLPDKMYTVIEAPMPKDLWRMYKEMKLDLITSLKEQDPESPIMTASNGAVKHQRLLLLCVGIFVDANEVRVEERHKVINEFKTDAIIDWRDSLGQNSCITWCHWRKQRENVVQKLKKYWPKRPVYQIYGGQKEEYRLAAMDAFSNPVYQDRVMDLVAQQAAGGAGLNLVNSRYSGYGSNGHSAIDRWQSEDRTHRRGQKHQVLYADFVAVGPDGQRTVEYYVIQDLKNHTEAAEITAREWIRRLKEE